MSTGLQPPSAVVIGIGEYEDDRIRKLEFAVADAEEFHKVLVDPDRGRFDPNNVKLLSGPKATKSHIRKEIRWLSHQVEKNPGATAVIFFCGHGECEADLRRQEADGYAKYLLPYDADARDLFSSALSIPEFNELLTVVNAKRLVILLDACFAGAVVDPKGATARGNVPDEFDISEDIPRFQAAAPGEPDPEPVGTVIIAAARSSQRSYEHQTLRHGIFTHHLIEALSGKGDFENDGYIRVREVFKYLEEKVPKTAFGFGQVQQPVMNFPLEEAPNLLLTEDVSRLKEIKRAERTAALRGLLHAEKDLTVEEFTEASAILDKQSPADSYKYLILLLDKKGSLETYRAIRDRDEAGSHGAVVGQQSPAPDPKSPVVAVVPPDLSEPSASRKRISWETLVKSAVTIIVAGGIGLTILHQMLFSPQIDMIAKDVDWEPRNPKVGQVVTFTGKFSAVYRVRQGLRWTRDEIAGKELADTFTATWSVDGRQTDIVDPRKIKTGDIVDTGFETTFQTPGNYTIGFSIKSRSLDGDETNDKMMRTISVLASN